MRFIAILLIISLSQLTRGQNIRINYTDTVLYEDYQTNNFTFPQKFNAYELFIIENNQYRLKRINKESNSIAFAKLDKTLTAFELNSAFYMAKTKNKNASCGFVLHGQSTGKGAILIEVNRKGRLKVSKRFDGQTRYLSGTPKEQGWIKTKAINKGGRNTIKVKVAKGYYDIYFNGKHAYTAFDPQFKQGKVGFYVNANSEMVVYNFLILEQKKGLEVPVDNPGGSLTVKPGGIADPEFQEVIKLFKVKIDEQEAQIKVLQKDLDRCKSTLNYDTTMVANFKTITANNRILTQKLDSTTRALKAANKRLKYLESLKEDIEKGSNGDLVLNLTSILATIKEENKSLKSEVSVLQISNTELKKDNEVLLREVERLKYRLGE
jgi:hypothetical protein